MNAITAGQKQRWAVSAGAAAVILAALMFLFRLPPAPTALPTASLTTGASVKPAVQLAARSDVLLKDETALRDLRPLFLPTDRNAALPPLKREPGRTFLDNEVVKLGFLESESSLTADLPPVATVNGKPAEQTTALDALASQAAATSLLGFGRNDVPVQRLTPRGGFVEIVSAGTGGRVLAEPVELAAGPPGDKTWGPLELMARIDAAGLASPLVVVTSSGVEEVDAHFRKFLAKTFRIGERISPGIYRVIVAP